MEVQESRKEQCLDGAMDGCCSQPWPPPFFPTASPLFLDPATRASHGLAPGQH